MARKSLSNPHEVSAVKSADRVIDIFLLLAQCPNGLQLKDISRELRIPGSSLYAILTTLKNRGFVERESGSLLYRLSLKVLEIMPRSNPSYSEDDLVSLALPVMEKIQQASQETVSLSVLVNNEIVFIGKRSGSGVVQVVNALGSRLPAHATGSGKVMLSFLSEQDIDRIFPGEELPRFTELTITSKTVLKEKLVDIKKLGYAIDYGESVVGVWAVAGCIHSPDGRPAAATSIIVPSFRVNNEQKDRYRDLIVGGAAEITSKVRLRASQFGYIPKQ